MGCTTCNGTDPFLLPIGPPGVNGTNGAQGLTGFSFRTGSGVPSLGLGIDGDSYVDIASPDLDLYTKAAGVWTDTGVDLKGLMGTAGTNGNLWFSTTGVPTSGLGSDGDFALDSLTGFIYTKIAGVWTFVVSTAGTVGATGTSFFTGVGIPPGGLGNNGDSYVDLGSSDLDVYTKSAGVWSDTGVNLKGLPGAVGADGFNFLQGSGVPSSGLGNDGDSYLDTATNDLYHKVLGSWVLTGNLSSQSITMIAQYGFFATNTLTTPTVTMPTAVGPPSAGFAFADDHNTPYFDNGNDFHFATYIVPVSTLKQRFIAENLTFEQITGGASGVTYNIRVFVNGVAAAGTLNTSSVLLTTIADEVFVPSIITDYLTLSAGDVVTLAAEVTAPAAAKGVAIKVAAGLVPLFSNSFE